MLSAVVFDFDGIIVDTEPLHYRAFQEVLQPLGMGYTWDEYMARYIGFDDRDAFREVFALNGRKLSAEGLDDVIARKAAAFQETIAKGVTPYPGAVELIGSIAGTLPLALCSGALMCDIQPILLQLGIPTIFDVLVTAEQVAASKPDPASYKLAVQKLASAFPGNGIAHAKAVAIEDTPAGIASATGAGLRVLAVTNSYPASKLNGAARIVDSLADVTIDSLSSLV